MGPAALRCSDDDRERVAELLRGHAAVGRLTVDELDERMAAALSAKTNGELAVQAPDLAGCFPDGELVSIAGAYHSPQLTHRDEWIAAVEKHLAR